MLLSDWFNKSFSPLEKTLRLPKIIKHGFILFFKRTFLLWFLFFVIWDLLIGSDFFIWLLSILSVLIAELFLLKGWYISKVLPSHTERVQKSKEIYSQCVNDPNHAYLKDFIEAIADNSAWSIVYFGYLSYATEVWELVFKTVYKFVVKSCGVEYSDLLSGLETKSYEADQELWELSRKINNADDLVHQEGLIDIWMDKYGSRATELDLKYPTLREQPSSLYDRINSYKSSPSPQSLLLEAKQKRTEQTTIVLDNLKVKKEYFQKLLLITQDHIRMREDIKLHKFDYDYYVRQLILLFAKKANVPQSEVFSYRWDALATKAG